MAGCCWTGTPSSAEVWHSILGKVVLFRSTIVLFTFRILAQIVSPTWFSWLVSS
jgi:hypothetical protein